MVMFASQVSQQIYQSQLAMAQQSQHAQMLSSQMGLMPQMSAFGAMTTGQTGVYGEQVANRLAGATRTTMGMAGLGVGVAGALTGLPLDPFSAAWSAGSLGMRMGGLPGAIGMGALGAAPFMAMGAVADVYGGAFMGGMRQQTATNSVLRNSFNFQGGQGAFGRGFSQQQMGQIGGLISQEVGRMPFSSSQELNQLIMQGSETGMFSAVRDVESFTRRFRTMLDGLRKIQRELGGTLSEALQFTRGAQQLGIFTSGGRTAFAAEMRDTMTATGMDQTQLFSLAATGSMMSRATGGVGRQGALGAMRTARQIGTAVRVGAINQELLSEATGGLMGEEAIQAFTARTLQMSDRFSRTARGRYSLFALANESGTGLDEDMLNRFRTGDISTGGIMRGAHSRVNRMGRARALNQEGRLRGAMMEEGGMSGQIGIMRLMLGDRALDQGDDLAQLVMQRRMGMTQQEAQVWTSLMRNQGQIAAAEDVDRSMGSRQVTRQRQASQRGIEAFVAQLEHGLQDATGVTAARQMGRNFLTRLSTLAERTMNDFLGIQASTLSGQDRMSLARVSMGMGTNADVERLNNMGPAGGTSNPFAQSLATRGLHAIERMTGGLVHFHTPQSAAEIVSGRTGTNFMGFGAGQLERMTSGAIAARAGVVSGADLTQMNALLASPEETRRRIMLGNLAGPNGAYGMFRRGGTSANAVDAAAQRLGMALPGIDPADAAGDVSTSNPLETLVSRTMRGARRGYRAGMEYGTNNGIVSLPWSATSLVGGLVGAYGGAAQGLYELMNTPRDRAAGFIARGGHLGQWGRQSMAMLEAGARTGNMRAVLSSLDAQAQRRGSSYSDAMTVVNATDRGLLGMGGISDADVTSVMGTDAFSSGLRALSGKPSEAVQKRQLDLMRRSLNDLPKNLQAAGTVALEQLRDNLKRTGMTGKEFATFTISPERQRELREEYSNISTNFGKALRGLGANSPFEEATRGAMEAFGGLATGGATGTAASGSVDTLVRQLSELDPSSADYQRAAAAFGGDPQTRGILTAASARRQGIRELTGGGRRGWKGAADAAFGALSGNTLGSMEFTLNGKRVRQNAAQVLYREFYRDGKGADSLQEQLIAQLKSSGIENAGDYVKELRSAIKKNGINSEEAGAVIDKLSKDERIKDVQTKALEQVQRANDPLGVHRNELLGKILTAVNKQAGIVEEAAGGPPAFGGTP